MPYSSEVFDNSIKELFARWKYKTYLDIGVGAGKYGAIIKSLSGGNHVTGIEIEKEYVERFGLENLYDEIANKDVLSIVSGAQEIMYDVVIMGDVLEHLLKSDGLDLVHFYVYRCKRMIVVYPSKYVQYDVGGKKSESHRSVWGEWDFDHFEHEHKSDGYMNMTVVRGYLDDEDAIINLGGQAS